MEENNLSLNQLDKISDLCINTLRKLVNDPSPNSTINSLSILAEIFGCSIKDLIEDNPEVLYFEKIVEKNNGKQIYDQEQVFSPDNIKYLETLLNQVGANCNITSYSHYRTASIKSEYELSPIQLDFNMRVYDYNNKTTLEIIDFYISVNQYLLEESLVTSIIINLIEIYAKKLHIDVIEYNVLQNMDRENARYLNEHIQLKVKSKFSYTLGTDDSFFKQVGYSEVKNPFFNKFQKKWRKHIS